MKIAWSSDAVQDVANAVDYGAQRWPEPSEQMAGTAVAAVAGLATFPAMGRTGALPGTRELVLRHYPFTVVYVVSDDVVTVLRVLHQHMKWPAGSL